MAYIKTTWKDRLVERPNTFEVQENPDGTITLIPTPGTVTQAGTPVNATNLNKIEDGIVNLENATAAHLAEDVIDDDPHKLNSSKRFATGNFNRDSGLPSGTQIVAGLGFKPKIIMFTAYVTGIVTGKYSEGTGSVAKNNCIFQTTTGLRNPVGDYCINIRQGTYSTSDYPAKVTNTTNDGFELTWSKGVDTVSEVIDVQYTAFG